MAEDKKISQTPAATPLTGSEIIVIVQDNETRQVLLATALTSVGANPSYLYGNESTDGSIRFHYNTISGEVEFQKRISGVWTNGPTFGF